MRTRTITWSLISMVLLLAPLAPGCGGGTPGTDGGPGGFDDHTQASLASTAAFDAFAKRSGRLSTVKFTITAFGDEARRGIVFYDGAFFRLHDEWYWFRLLNGQPMPGDDEAVPVEGLEQDLTDLRQIYAWANAQVELPLDLRFTSHRLYSPRFYRVALDVYPKVYGLGSLIRIEPAGGEGAGDGAEGKVRWAFQLEYTDDSISHAELVTFFETLAAALPEAIATRLHWLVRSSGQQLLAGQMEQQGLPYGDRILRYGDITTPGEVEVYNPGLTAGRVLIANDGSDLARTSDESILVLPEVPDELPAATAVISAVPQTPLAHINLLAQNRGIPNLYLGDALMHPELQRLDASYGWAILRAEAPDRMSLAPISAAEYARYKQLKTLEPVVLPPIDPASLPLTIDLGGQPAPLGAIAGLRPVVGGKSAGFLALLAQPEVDVPDRPLALTVRSYLEHVAELRPLIKAMLAERVFAEDARIRFLVLEGRDDFDRGYREPSDQAAADSFVAARPAGDALGDLVRAGGLKRRIRDKPIAPQTLAELTATIEQQFAELSPEQGLRLRSSSTVEDVEGFNGAGLYDSNTGFVDPSKLAEAGDRKKTLGWAIKKTWASYWAFAAFEERRRERIDHLGGAMGVLVHPRFGDALELANGVFTFTVLPQASGHAQQAVLELNVQKGALSVTNPEATHLPEVDRLVLAAGASAPTIERVSASTVAQPGEKLLTDEQLRALFDQARAVTEGWLAQGNQGVATVQRARSLTLDFEFRYMDAGWPARRSGPSTGKRMVIKQARSLEPGLRRLAAGARMLPAPRDLLSRARRIHRRRCTADGLAFELVELLTDPALRPDLGHAEAPFVVWLRLTASAEQPALGWPAGELLDLYHLQLTDESVGRAACVTKPHCPVTLTVDNAGMPTAPTRVELRGDGSYRIERGVEAIEGTIGGCEPLEVLHSTPAEYLLGLLAEQAQQQDRK